MATTKKQAATPSKSTKPTVVAKKVATAPVKKAMPEKKAAQKPATKKELPPVKPVAKVVAAKTVEKSPSKNKTVSETKKVVNNNIKTVNKKNSPAPVAKKSVPVKPAEPAKKAVIAKKTVTAPPPAAKKAETAKPAAKVAAKPVAKEVAKPVEKAAKQVAKETAVPAKKVVAPVETPVAKVATPTAKKAVPKKTLPVNHIPVKAGPPAPRPMATPAARSTEKKPNVIIAHRRLENKSKVVEVANTMIEYQPETYRSILDEPQQTQGPIYRYSDEDLNEFRDIINSRLDAARKELNYLQGLITRKDEAGTDDTENRYMNMEDGSGAMEREQLAQLASRQIQFMGNLEKALIRIENKTYGICRVTGKLIDKARLRAVPHATLSIEAKKAMAPRQNS